MINEEILSKSRYFKLVKGLHRKQKKIKPAYRITARTFIQITDRDQINLITKDCKSVVGGREVWDWHFKKYEDASKIFMMLSLSGF